MNDRWSLRPRRPSRSPPDPAIRPPGFTLWSLGRRPPLTGDDVDSQSYDPPRTSPFGDWRTVLAIAAVVVVGCVGISGRSLWIDEACTATKAVPPTLGGWWQALSQDQRSADAQRSEERR